MIELILNCLPAAIVILLATIIGIIDKTSIKKSQKLTRVIIILLIISAVCQIILTIYNKNKEIAAGLEEKRLNEKSDSLTYEIILKEDTIREFFETYILRDSIQQSNYDSINKIVIEKDRAILTMYAFLIKEDDDKYSFGFKIRNDGTRAATIRIGKEYIIKNVNDSLICQASQTLQFGESTVISTDYEVNASKTFIMHLTEAEFIAPTYIYIYITYGDLIIPSKKYDYRMAYRTGIYNYGKDSSEMGFCKPWEQSKIEKLLGIK